MKSTATLGGRAVTPDELAGMQASDCILHVRRGELREVPVRKMRMPRDPGAHYQGLSLIEAPGGAIYAFQRTVVSRSTDRGETWEHLQRDPERHGFAGWCVQFNQDGTLLAGRQESREIWASADEGESWSRFGRIDVAPFGQVIICDNITRLADGTLLLPGGGFPHLIHTEALDFTSPRCFIGFRERAGHGPGCTETPHPKPSERKSRCIS